MKLKFIFKYILLSLILILVGCGTPNNIIDTNGIENSNQKEEITKEPLLKNVTFDGTLSGEKEKITFNDDCTFTYLNKTYEYNYENIESNIYSIWSNDYDQSFTYYENQATLEGGDARIKRWHDMSKIETIDINFENFEKYYELIEEIIKEGGTKDVFGNISSIQYHYHYSYVLKNSSNLLDDYCEVYLKYDYYGDHGLHTNGESYVISSYGSAAISLPACSAADYTHQWDTFRHELVDVAGTLYVIK